MRLPLFPGPTWNPCEVLTRGLRGRNIHSGMGSALGKLLPAYSCLFLPFCRSSLGRGSGRRETSTTSVRPRAQGSPPMVTALPWPDTATLSPPSALHTHAHTHLHTHTRTAPSHKKPAEDPHRWASRFSPQGPGHLTLTPQEGGYLDFWDTQRGDHKARRRESLKTFSVTPATFRGIGHWRVSAISLSQPVSTPCSCPFCNLHPWLPGEAAPDHGRAPLRALKQPFLRARSSQHCTQHSLTHSLVHWASISFTPTMCQALYPVLGVQI